MGGLVTPGSHLQSLLGPQAAGTRAETVLKKGASYTVLKANTVDLAELPSTVKGRPGASGGRSSFAVTWPDDSTLASKLFTVLSKKFNR